MNHAQPLPRATSIGILLLALALRAHSQAPAVPPATPAPTMEQQPTSSVLLPGLYLDEARSPLKVGTRAPDFTLSRCAFDANRGRELKLSSWLKAGKGNGSVVIFWAFWCDTWKDMTRDLGALKPQLSAMRLQVLAISVDASQQPVSRRAFESGRIWWPVAIDADKSVTEAWGVRRVPTIFVLGKGGMVRAVFEGFPGKTSFVRQASAALKIAAPGAKVTRR